MKLSKDQLVTALEFSYDYASARALAPEFLQAAGVATAVEFDGAAVERIYAVLAAQPRHARTLEKITALTGVGPKPAAPPASDKPAAKAEKADDKKADKADDKKADKADDKKADKADDKKADKKAAAEKADDKGADEKKE